MKDRKKLLHIHSSVEDKQPTPQSLEYGELAVNYASGNTFISTKNNADNVVRFSEDDTLVNWMEYKEVFPYSGLVGGRGENHKVTEQDLLENKSNLLFKLNQVVARNTVKGGDVNNQTDIYGNPINPSSDSGLTDGAGFAIDMSAYSLISGNPYFNSVETNCVTNEDTLNIGALSATNIGFNCDETLTQNVNVGASDTILIKGGKGAMAAMSGNLGLSASGSILESSEEDIIITANSGVCVQGGEDASLYGVANTNIGISCDGSLPNSESVTVGGNNVNIKANDTVGINADYHNEVAQHGIVEYVNSGNIENYGRQIIQTANETIHQSAIDISQLANREIRQTSYSGIVQTSYSSITSTARNKLEENANDIVEEATLSIWNKANYIHLSASTQASIQSLSDTLVASNGDVRLIGIGGVDTRGGRIKVTTNNPNPSNGDISVNAQDTVTVTGRSIYADASNDALMHGDVKATLFGGQITYVGQEDNGSTSNVTHVRGDKIDMTGKSVDIVSNASAVTINSNDEVNIGGNNTPNVKIEPLSSTSVRSEGIYIGANGIDSGTTNGIIMSSNTSIGVEANGNITINSDNQNVGISAKGNILNSAEGDVYITANNDICEGAGNVAAFYGEEETNIGVGCNGNKTKQLTIGGESVCFEADERASVFGETASDLGINCAEDSISYATRVSGETVNVGGEEVIVEGTSGITIESDDKVLINGGSLVHIKTNGDESAIKIGPDTATNKGFGVLTFNNNNVLAGIQADTVNIDCGNINIGADDNVIVNGDNIVVGSNSSHAIYNGESIEVNAKQNGLKITSDKHIDINSNYNINLHSSGDTLIDSKGYVNITSTGSNGYITIAADHNICEIANENAYFYGSGGTHIGMDCLNNKSQDIKIYRNQGSSDVSGNTVDEAIDRLWDMSQVTMDTETPSDANISKIYKLYQNGRKIGDDIVIPKDQFLKSASIVSGMYIGDDFYYCKEFSGFERTTSISGVVNCRTKKSDISDCIWDKTNKCFVRADKSRYQKVIFDCQGLGSGGITAYEDVVYTNDGSGYTYNGDDLVYASPASGCNWYIEMVFNAFDPSTGSYTENVVHLEASTLVKDYDFINNSSVQWTETYDGNKTNVTADFTVQVAHNGATSQFIKNSGVHSIPSYVLNISSGDVKSFSADTFDPFAQTTGITIPTSVAHLNRGILTVNYGKPSVNISSVIYDPSTSSGVTIPKSFKHLEEFNGTCYILDNDICMSGHDVTARAFYSKSDLNLKANVKGIDNEDINKVSNIPLKEFIFKNDESKTKTYGVIAQEVNAAGLGNIVHTDADGMLGVDYTSLLILKIANLENTISEMKKEIDELKNKMQ